MRYHKAIKITRPEADYIINTQTRSLNKLAVMVHHQQWYDVRSLTNKEVDSFLADLVRADFTDLEAGCIMPH